MLHTVSRQSVAELQGRGALVPTGANALVRNDVRTDVRGWANRVPVSPAAMLAGGIAVAGIGVVLAALVSLGFFGTIAAGSMITAGGGIAFLGLLKWVGREQPAAHKALPAGDPTVLRERARRVAAVLAQHGDATFERLLAQLRWTEQAMVDALVYMKDAGMVVEDLDLDSGEWVYRLQEGDAAGTPASLTLADRQARS